MDAPAVHTDFYADFHGLSEMRARAAGNGEQSLREVAGQFEALFIQMMLKSMRDANLGEGLLDSQHTKTYQSMFDQQIALDLSKREGLGLADMLVQQLGRPGEHGLEQGSPPVSPHHQSLIPPVRDSRRNNAQVQAISSKEDIAWSVDTPSAFVQTLWPHARAAAEELGTRPEILISQAALETGWGKHTIRGRDGRESYNLFGIKADTRWQGERVVTDTVEFRNGLMRKEQARFRAYASPEESFADYVAFLKSNPRYQRALEMAADAPAFTLELARAGYATDPEYSNKINKIMASPAMRDALSRVKETLPGPLTTSQNG